MARGPQQRRRRKANPRAVVVATAAVATLWSHRNGSGNGNHNGMDVVAYVPQLGISVYSPTSRLYHAFSFSAGPPSGDNDNDDNNVNNDAGEEQPFFGSYQGPPGHGTGSSSGATPLGRNTGTPPPLKQQEFNDDPFNSFFPSSPTGAGPNPFAAFPASATGAGPNPFQLQQPMQPPVGPSPSDDPYYQQKFAQMDAKEQARKDAASQGLQEKTFQRLQQLEQQRKQQRREDAFEQSVDAIRQERRNDPNNPQQPSQEQQQRQRNIMSQAAEEAKAKAEELRREWEAQHPVMQQKAPFPTTGGTPTNQASNPNPFASMGATASAPAAGNPFASMGGQSSPTPPTGTTTHPPLTPPGRPNVPGNPFASMGGQSPPTSPFTTNRPGGEGNGNPFTSKNPMGGPSVGGQSAKDKPSDPSAASKSVFNFFGGTKEINDPPDTSNNSNQDVGASTYNVFGSFPPPNNNNADRMIEENRRREEAKARFRAQQGQGDVTTPPNVTPPQSGSTTSPPLQHKQQDSGSGMPSYADTDEFKRRQEAAIRQQEAEEKEATRLRMLEAKRREQEANIRRVDSDRKLAMEDPARKAALEEEMKRREAIRQKEEAQRKVVEDTNRTSREAEEKRKVAEAARQARLEAAQKINLEQAEKEKLLAEEKRRKMQEARDNAIRAARNKAEEEKKTKEDAEKARKLEEAERTQAARMKAETRRYRAEAETSRQEIRNFVESKGRRLQQQQQHQQQQRIVQEDDQYLQDEIELRAEEARRWADEEARRKTGGLPPPVTDFEGGPAPARGFAAPTKDDPESLRIRNVYTKWCNFYGKRFDERRLITFSQNLYEIESHYSDTGEPVQLNEFADLTAEEYEVRERDPFLWEENELLRWAEDEQMRIQGLPPLWDDPGAPYDMYGVMDDDAWRRDEAEWGGPTRRKPLRKDSKAARPPTSPDGAAPADAARYRGEYESGRKAELKAKQEEEEKKLKEAEVRQLEDAKLRGEELAKKKEAIDAKRAAEEEEAKVWAFEEAQRRGEEEAKRRAELDAKKTMEERRLDEAQRKAMEDAKFRGQSMRGEPQSTNAYSSRSSIFGPDRADAGIGQDGNQVIGRKGSVPLADDTRRRMGTPLNDMAGKGIDSWQAALLRGEEEAQQKAILEEERGKEQRRIEEEKKRFHENVTDRARREAAMREEAIAKMKKQEEESQKLVLEEAKRRAQEDQRKRDEILAKQQEELKKQAEQKLLNDRVAERARIEAAMREDALAKTKQREEEAQRLVMEEAKRRAQEDQRKREEMVAKQQEEMKQRAEIERRRKEEAARIAEEANKRRQEEQMRLQEHRARQMETERLRREETKRLAMEEAKRKAEELARKQEERINLAKLQQERMEQAKRQAAEQARQRLHEIEQLKVAQMKQAEEANKRREIARKEAIKQKQSEQEAMEVASLAARREAALEMARKKAEQEEAEKQKFEEERKMQRQATLRQMEEEQRLRAAHDADQRDRAEKERKAMMEAAARYNGKSGQGKPFEKPKPKAPAKSSPFGSYMGSIDQQGMDPTGFSAIPPPQATSGVPRSETGNGGGFSVILPPQVASDSDSRGSSETIASLETYRKTTQVESESATFSKTSTDDTSTPVPSGIPGKVTEEPKKNWNPFARTKPPPAKIAERTSDPSYLVDAAKAKQEEAAKVESMAPISTNALPPKSYAPFGSWKDKTKPAAAGIQSFADSVGASENEAATNKLPEPSGMDPSPASAKDTMQPKKSFAPYGRKPEILSGSGISSFADTFKSSSIDSLSVDPSPMAAAFEKSALEAEKTKSEDQKKKSYNPFGGWKEKMRTAGGGMSSYADSMDSAKGPGTSDMASPTPEPDIRANPFPPVDRVVDEAKKSFNPFGGGYKTPQSGFGAPLYTNQMNGSGKSDMASPTPGPKIRASPFPPVDRPKSYAPFGSKPKIASGSGLPSYTDQVTGTAESFSVPSASLPDVSRLEPSAMPPSSQQQQSKDISSGMPSTRGTSTSYMDQVAKTFVDETSKLNELKKDIVRMEQESNQGNVSPPPPLSSPSETEKSENGAGVPTFLNQFFGGKPKEPKVQAFPEAVDGSFKPKSVGNLPFFMSGSAPPRNPPAGTETSIPIITMWGQTSEGSIYGFISGSANFEDGAYIMTSPVDQGAKGGCIVTTASGSQYQLAVQPSIAPSK